MSTLTYQEMLTDLDFREDILKNYKILKIINNKSNSDEGVTQTQIAEYIEESDVKGSIDEIRRTKVKGPFEKFINMRLLTIDPDDIDKVKNRKYHISDWGLNLLKDDCFDIFLIDVNMQLKENNRKPVTALKKIRSYNPDEIKSLMKNIRQELLIDNEIFIVSDRDHDNLLFDKIQKFNFEEDPLYLTLIQFRKGFFPEFIQFLELLELYRLQNKSWIEQKRIIYFTIDEMVKNKMSDFKIDPSDSYCGENANINIKIYNNNLIEWIFKNKHHNISKRNKELIENGNNTIEYVWEDQGNWIDLRLDGAMVFKISKGKNSIEFQDEMKKFLNESISTEKDEFDKLFKKMNDIFLRKERIEIELFKVLELIIKKDYSKL